jgi:hypothetical protein
VGAPHFFRPIRAIWAAAKLEIFPTIAKDEESYQRGGCCMQRNQTSGRLVLLLFFMLWLAEGAYGQFKAAVQGTVVDMKGAVLAGATVTLVNKETGRAQQVITTDVGFYRISGLPPGTYTISAELSGFKKKVLENVVVGAEEVRGIDFTLEPGEVKETITVTAEGPAILTESSEISGRITTSEILRLPQVGRDPYELVRLTPGVFGLGARDGRGGSVGLPNTVGPGGSNDQIFATENRPPVTANGQRVEANNFQIDGVTAMSQAWGGAAVVTPNQESVKEIRVLANHYSAEYGRNTGAQVLVVSQNGTNEFHGSLFFKRNAPGLNAFQHFNRAGTAIREDPQRVEQILSQWGGSVGGPIRKNKLFFFFSYETVRRSSNRLEGLWIETPQYFDAVKNLGSIASTIFNFVGRPRIASVDDSKDCAAAGFTDPTKCRKVAGGLDIGSINRSAARGTIQPDTGGGLDGIPDIQFAQLLIPDKTTAQQFNFRVDYLVTKDDLVAFSMYWVPNDRTFNDAWGNRARPALDFTSARRNMVGTLLWTRTISPTMINEARFNATRWYFDEVASNRKIGWGLPKTIVCFNPGCHNWGGTGVGPGVFFQTTYNFRDTLSKVVNAHALKFGVDIIAEQNNDRAPWAGRPTYWFNNPWSFANDAPESQDAFFDPKTGAFTELTAYVRSKYYALFVQDDWKLRPNLTVNLGLRWEYFTPLRSKNDHISNLVLGPRGDLLGARLKVGGNLYEPDRNNFGPQVGFAWSPTRFANKAVVRGGFGIGFNRLPGSRLWESRFNPPFFAGFHLTPPDLKYAVASDINTFGYPANPRATLTFDPNTGLPLTGPPVGINATLQKVPNSYAYRYSLELEYNVGGNWIASLGYQGSAAHKLPRLVPYHLFVTPHPRISRVSLMLTDVNSNFNAMLVGIRHRFAHGFTFDSEYRWSKSLDTCSNDHDCRQSYPFDQTTEYGPSDFDVRHAFKAFGMWELPLFRGRKDWVGKLAGGWELSGILTASSGFPWTPVVGGSACGAVVAGGGVCPLRPIAQIRPPATGDTSNRTFLGAGQFPGGGLRYFVPPPSGQFTVPPRPGVGRNIFRGPGYFSVDMTAVKRFGLPAMRLLGENGRIEIRINAYNVFNRLNLAPFQANDDNTQIQHPDFGRALHALSGRVIEFQARFSF